MKYISPRISSPNSERICKWHLPRLLAAESHGVRQGGLPSLDRGDGRRPPNT